MFVLISWTSWSKSCQEHPNLIAYSGSCCRAHQIMSSRYIALNRQLYNVFFIFIGFGDSWRYIFGWMRITSLYPVSFEKSMSQKCSALDDAEIKQKKTWQTYNSQTPVVSSWFNKRLRFPNLAPLFVEQVAPQKEQLPAMAMEWSSVPGVPTTSTASTTVVKPSRSNLTWRRNRVDKKLDILDILCSFYGMEGLFWSIHFKMKGHMEGDAWLADYCIQYTSNRSSMKNSN